jgi:hypothetical protein
MVLKFSQQMKHAQMTEKYIRLIFNSYISDDDFFQKSMRIIDTNYFFSGDFQDQEGVRIMHQCALCNPKYGNHIWIKIKCRGYMILKWVEGQRL